MKRALFLLVAVLVMAGFSGCLREQVVPNGGDPGVQGCACGRTASCWPPCNACSGGGFGRGNARPAPPWRLSSRRSARSRIPTTRPVDRVTSSSGTLRRSALEGRWDRPKSNWRVFNLGGMPSLGAAEGRHGMPHGGFHAHPTLRVVRACHPIPQVVPWPILSASLCFLVPHKAHNLALSGFVGVSWHHAAIGGRARTRALARGDWLRRLDGGTASTGSGDGACPLLQKTTAATPEKRDHRSRLCGHPKRGPG
jgi:hypothetical protein